MVGGEALDKAPQTKRHVQTVERGRVWRERERWWVFFLAGGALAQCECVTNKKREGKNDKNVCR